MGDARSGAGSPGVGGGLGSLSTSGHPLPRGDTATGSSQPRCPKTFRGAREPQPRVSRAARAPARLSVALSRRRRCRTSVLPAAAAPGMPRAGGGGTRDCPPSSCGLQVLSGLRGGSVPGPPPDGCFPGRAASADRRPRSRKAGPRVAGHLTSSAFPEVARFPRAGLLKAGN